MELRNFPKELQQKAHDHTIKLVNDFNKNKYSYEFGDCTGELYELGLHLLNRGEFVMDESDPTNGLLKQITAYVGGRFSRYILDKRKKGQGVVPNYVIGGESFSPMITLEDGLTDHVVTQRVDGDDKIDKARIAKAMEAMRSLSKREQALVKMFVGGSDYEAIAERFSNVLNVPFTKKMVREMHQNIIKKCNTKT